MTPSVLRNSPTLVVADASVIVRWVLPDEETCDGSERLLSDVRNGRVALVEPPLIMYEIANSLSKAAKRQRILPSEALLAWRSICSLGMLFSVPGEHGELSLHLSVLPGVSAYDASYVALSEARGCNFYTADTRLAAAVRSHTDRVRLISEYGD